VGWGLELASTLPANWGSRERSKHSSGVRAMLEPREGFHAFSILIMTSPGGSSVLFVVRGRCCKILMSGKRRCVGEKVLFSVRRSVERMKTLYESEYVDRRRRRHCDVRAAATGHHAAPCRPRPLYLHHRADIDFLLSRTFRGLGSGLDDDA